MTDENHDDERQPHDRQAGENSSQNRRPFGITSMQGGSVTHVCGAVDSDRSRCRLADGYDVSKLSIAEPLVFLRQSRCE